MIQKDIIKLIDSICDNFMNGYPGRNWAPQRGDSNLVTYCNYFVNGVCKAMGYDGFTNGGKTHPMLANDMVDFMSDDKNGWMKVSCDVAQAHANSGALVIAGQKENGHGHVCIVRPGTIGYSPNWGTKTPRVANIGKDVFIDKYGSYAFQKEPSYFVLKEMI